MNRIIIAICILFVSCSASRYDTLYVSCVQYITFTDTLSVSVLEYTRDSSDASVSITGLVRDSVAHYNMPGAKVSVNGTKIGVVANNDGIFRISKVRNNDTLFIRFIGYKNKEMRLNDLTRVKIY